MPSRNPTQSADRTARTLQQELTLDIAKVTSIDRGSDNEVEVSFFSDNETAVTQATVPGDFAVPPEGTDVVLTRQRTDDAVIVGILPTDEQTPDVSQQTRRIAHQFSDAYIEFTDDGVVKLVSNDGTTATLSNGSLTVN